MDKYTLIGLIVGLIVGALLVIVFIFATRKGPNRHKLKYDERQIAAQGIAYKAGFFTYFGLFAIFTFFEPFGIELPFEFGFMSFLCLVIGICVMATIAIAKDAYFSMNEKVPLIKIIFALIGVMNIFIGVNNYRIGKVIENGKIGMGGINFVCGIMMIYILAIILLKDIMDKKED